MQHSEAKGLSNVGSVVDSDGNIATPAGRINDTLHRLKAKGSIDSGCFAAGLRLQDLYAVAELEPIGSAPLERVSCAHSEGPLTDAVLAARSELVEAMNEIVGKGTIQALAVYRCICEGYTIGAFQELEREADGSRLHAMMITGLIRGGLERLAVVWYSEVPSTQPRPDIQGRRGSEIWGLAQGKA
ncbi:MAG: hypothetical protein ACR2RE_18425 [Geminicoccaceae bacterium]